MSLKIDLHNHTVASYDGFNTLKDFEKAHRAGKIDIIAITDHNTISVAQEFVKRASFPIIVGEEIESQAGDIIGLFLKETIPKGLSVKETIAMIKSQDGLVYIPHPFDFFRIGLPQTTILEILPQIDLFEVVNGAYSTLLFRKYEKEAKKFAKRHFLTMAASSDAHLPQNIGRAVMEIPEELLTNLTPQNLLQAVRTGKIVTSPGSFLAEIGNLLFKRYPKTLISKLRHSDKTSVKIGQSKEVQAIVFTNHALERMGQRQISRAQIVSILQNPEEQEFDQKLNFFTFSKTFGNFKIGAVWKLTPERQKLVVTVWKR